MRRREFLAASLPAAGAAIGAMAGAARGADPDPKPVRRFRLRYAPHFGMFRNLAGDDPIAQIRFMREQGFTALEDNGMKGRPVELQERIAREMERLGMAMGVFVAYGNFKDPTFVSGKADHREAVLKSIRESLDVAKRVRAKWMTVVPGAFDPGMEPGYQTANCIETLKRCAEICEPAGLVMVLEPLNPWANHPGLFLTKIPQAYLICRAVGSPSCKILFDIYHQQITEGNLIPNMKKAWSEIGYFQIGDNPGRKEPTTGEINYKNIFKFLHGQEYDGILGMEHGVAGRGGEGEKALIDAYVACDAF
ncbi:MAG: TIM barrel protein [Planctomycetes bacterium]|nr:TIM barrel protein [Planctomycetota bacterium]